MLGALLIGLIIVVVCIFPVMFIAQKLGAGKSELVDCIIAVVVGSFVSSLIAPMLPGADTSALLATAYSLLITGVVYKFMLEATYIAGILIALVPAIIYFILDIVLS